MRLNLKPEKIVTHEGGIAKRINAKQELERSVMACLLWEDHFYVDGVSVADRVANLIPKVKPDEVANIAICCRKEMKIRHMPLFIVREMARHNKHKKLVSKTLYEIINRPDELCEFLAIYWKDGRTPISAQVKKGLAKAFTKFDAYQLAKYNRPNAIKLRDVMFLTHPKPVSQEQANVWKKLVDNELPAPDTWEVALSKKDGVSKKVKWERLLKENRLGAMALLRNLRNMEKEGVSKELIIKGIENMNVRWVLPFRFISAAIHAPAYEPYLEKALFKCLRNKPKLKGKTVVLVDVSGSMDWVTSSKSKVKLMDCACGLAIIANEVCEECEVYTFSEDLCRIAPRSGFALRDAIIHSQRHQGTYLGKTLEILNKNADYYRIIVITDEQVHDTVGKPKGLGYMINVGSYKNGVGYGKWHHIDGWSEAVIDYIIKRRLINGNKRRSCKEC